MKHLKKVLALLCVLALLLGIVPVVSAADQGEFTILSTTDMHGRCWDTNILNDTGANNTMLHVSTAVDAIRAQKENVILIENGDTYQGTPVSSYQLSLQKQGLTDLPNPMALTMKEIGYDASVIGNHEFNYDWETMSAVREYLADETQGNAVPTLCANLYYDGTDGIHAAGENVYEAYMIREITLGENTYKIAIIGFENTDCPRWDVPDNYPGIVFTHPDNTTGSMAWEAERYLEQVEAEGADFVVVAYHSGLGSNVAPEDIVFGQNSENQILSMIKNTEGIGMVIAGHDHSTGYSGNTYQDKGGNEVIVVNGGGNNLTSTTFGIDADGKVYLKSHQDLALSNYVVDTELKAKIQPYVDLASEYVNQVCGTILPGTWSKSTNFYLQQTDTMDFINRAQIAQGTVHLAEKYDTEEKVAALYEATGLDHLTVDVSSTSVVVNGSYTVQPGQMSMKDIYRLYRYDNNLYLVPLTGEQIKEVLEFNASERLSVNTASGQAVFSCIGDSFTNPIFYGLDFKYDMAQEKGSRIVDLKFADGREFEMDKTYIMAINNYHLGNGPFAAYSTDDAIWSQTDDMGGGVVQDLIAEFLKAETEAKGGVSPAPSNWELIYSKEIETGVATGDYILHKLTAVEDLYDGATVAVYHIAGNQLMTNTANGSKLAPSNDVSVGGIELGTNDTTALFTAHLTEDGYFTLTDADGKFVTSGATGNSLSMTEEESEYSLWEIILTETEGQIYIRNVNAAYGGNKNQHLEVYGGGFTTYGLGGGGDAYLMSLYVEPQIEGDYILEQLNTAEELADGSTIAIYHIAGDQLMTNTASGSKLAPSTDVNLVGKILGTSDATALFTVHLDENGYFTLMDGDGKFVTSGATGNSLSMTEEESEYSLWEIVATEAEGDFYIRNVNAAYGGNKNQHLEVYGGAFTTYGLQNGGDAYLMRIYTMGQELGICLHMNTVVEDAVDATCTEDGYTGDTWCLDCGELVLGGEVIEAPGHTGGTATCCAKAVCTECGESYGELNPENHGGETEIRDAKEATCTEEGYTGDTYCLDCGEKITDGEVIPATGHIGETEIRNAKDATCTEDGYTGDTYCLDCGEKITDGEVIPANSDNCPSKQFTDLVDDWYHEGVDFVVANGLMIGVSDTKLAPQSNMTRAQMAMILYRMAGEPSVEGMENPFADVKDTAWYADAVIWAANEGITKGVSADKFAPDQEVTREQFVTLLYRACGAEAVEEDHLAAFADGVSVSDWAEEAMNWAVARGIILGMPSGKLEPKAYTTRAQIAVMIMRFVELPPIM